jgi:pimeloyl-ACP methyl ester carboxylesterase
MSNRHPPRIDPREAHHVLPSPIEGLQLFLRHLPPRDAAKGVVLYVHGATFPSALSIAHRFDGWSWRDALCEAGFHVWGLDLLGYGESDRYPEMAQPADAHPALGRAEEASRQIAAAARLILDHHAARRLSIIAHSWGTIAAARFAGEHPQLLERLVLFGPIAWRAPSGRERPPAPPAWRTVSLQDQWTRFVEDVPPGGQPTLWRRHFADWGERYLDSDPDSRRRSPAGVRIPAGPVADILDAWHGNLAYDPALVRAPVAIIRGAWDGVVPDDDARRLFDAFAASPIKRDIKIGRATHLMHLETMRFALYRESIAFLQGGDEAPMPPP